ncbi:MAG: hypothetical protein NZM04_00300, partial [Methylacidiphilales bacterium]|nr:hypothetical protein [Candidatus Methylacidiphilales bacterium]
QIAGVCNAVAYQVVCPALGFARVRVVNRSALHLGNLPDVVVGVKIFFGENVISGLDDYRRIDG